VAEIISIISRITSVECCAALVSDK